MAAVWAEAEVQMHVDGTALPGETKAFAEYAATQGGKAFKKRFDAVMYRAGLSGSKQFASGFMKSFGRLMRTIITSSGAFRRLSRDMRVLGQAARGGLGLALDGLAKGFRGVLNPLRELNFEVRNESAKTWNMLREGAAELGISMNDLRDTFPGITQGFRNVRTAVVGARDGFRDFGTALKEDAGKTTEILREGMSKLKISLDDVKDTFPGVTRAVGNLRDGFNRVRTVVGNVGTTLKELGPDMDQVRPAAEELGNSFRRLGDRLRQIIPFSRGAKAEMLDLKTALANLAVDEEGPGVFNNLSLSLADLSGKTEKATKSGKSFFSQWKKMPHGLRQVIIWTAAIIGGMEQIATLSSAAGGGLLVLLGAATQFGIGIGATIAVFQDLNDELETLPEWLRPAAAAFQGIGTAFSEMQDSIQQTALKDAAADFDTIAGIVRALIPAFQPLAEVIGNAIGGLADGLKPGTEAFEDLYTLVRNSAPTFDTLLRTAGKLGGALLSAFADPRMQKAIQGLVGWIEDLVDSFDDFVKGDEFGPWIENTISIMESLGGLLEATATALNNLVTPDAVQRTTDFLDNMAGAMPFLESLVAVFGELDVFGLIALALNELGSALTPILQVMEPVASFINDVLILAFELLGNAAGMLAGVLLPVRLGFELLALIYQRALEHFQPLIDAFDDVSQAMQDASDKVYAALEPAFEAIATAVTDMLPSPEEFERFLREDLIPMIDRLAQWIIDEAVPALEDFAKWLEDEGVPAMEAFWQFMSEFLIPIFRDIVIGIGVVVRSLVTFANGVVDAINKIARPVKDAIKWFQDLFGAASAANGAAAAGGGGGRGRLTFASGGVLTGPRNILAGEAGPEAIIPLNRALSQVDPSVRWLSAIAQGKNPAMAGGGVVGGGKSLTIQSGAITVVEAGDGRRSANDVMQRLVEYAVG